MTKLPAKTKHTITLAAHASIGLLKTYQWTLSPAFAAFGVRCRHIPSCSHYGCDAYHTHGFWKGSWLTLSRLLRCHPWGSSGYDPVPENLEPQGIKVWRYGDWSWTKRPFAEDIPSSEAKAPPASPPASL